MAPSMTQSATAGSSTGRSALLGRSTCSAMAGSKRSLQDTVLLDLPSREGGNDTILAEDMHPVAVFEFLEFGRIPEERPALLGFGLDQFVDVLLGADINTAHRIVEHDDPCLGGEGSGKQDLLLIAAAQAQEWGRDVGSAHLHLVEPGSCQIIRPLGRDHPGARQAVQAADDEVVADRPERENSLDHAIARDEGYRRA